jgi:hypothetical protein
MSTRKLILWALVCGVFILGAGTFKLWQTSGSDARVILLQLSDTAVLGDMTVSVQTVTKTETNVLVEVTMVGVEGADAMSGWRMLSGGVVSEAVEAPITVENPCSTTQQSEVVECVIAFPVSQGTPTIAYIRAGQQEQWATTP